MEKDELENAMHASNFNSFSVRVIGSDAIDGEWSRRVGGVLPMDLLR